MKTLMPKQLIQNKETINNIEILSPKFRAPKIDKPK